MSHKIPDNAGRSGLEPVLDTPNPGHKNENEKSNGTSISSRHRVARCSLYGYVPTHVCAVEWTYGKILAIKLKRTNEKMLEFLRYVATK